MTSLLDDIYSRRIQAAFVRAQEIPAFIRHAQKIGADFSINVTTAEQLMVTLETIGSHNDYDAVRVATALGPFVSDSMRVRIKEWAAGPAIYFQVPFFEDQRLRYQYEYKQGGIKLTPEQRYDFVRDIIAVAKGLDADEISVAQMRTREIVWGAPGTHPFEIRLWWD